MKVNFNDALHISGKIINAYPMDCSVNLDPALLFDSGRRLDMDIETVYAYVIIVFPL